MTTLKPKYRIYIDEVGNPDLASSASQNHRFLSLTGVIFELAYIESTVFPQLEALKRKYFHSHPDDPIVLHRKEMVNAKPPFEALQDSEIQTAFDQELLTQLSIWKYTVISVCLDKKKHMETYATWRYDPYHYCLAMLIERYVLFLKRRRSIGDVMAESRGGKEDMRLKKSFERLRESGTEYVKPDDFQQVLTSRQLKVKTKANNIAGLQVTDVIAHPSRCELLNEQNLLGRELAPFAKQVIAILQTKYDQSEGRMFGKKFL